MQRCSSGFLTTLTISLVVVLAGCLGKSTSNTGNGGVQSVTLSPGGNASLDVGSTQVFSASGRDAQGRAVIGGTIQFVVSVPPGTVNPGALSVASNGNACAGTWDANVAICSPGGPGVASVTAVINGVSSAPTTVYVHQHIDSIQILPAQTKPPIYDCFSQGQTWLFQGIAYNNNIDITSSVGPLIWSSSNGGVVTPDTTVTGLLPNQVQMTARTPGITQLTATVSGTTSNPFPYTTCLIQSVWLQIGGQGQAGNSITVTTGGSVTVTATAVDTLYPFTHTVLTNPPLTWSTTNPAVAAFTTTTSTAGTNSASARLNIGGTTLTASCTPPSCNIGVLPGLPIYASTGTLPNGTPGFSSIQVNVVPTTNAKPVVYNAWAATTGCNDAPGCASAFFSVTPGTSTPIGPIVSLPWTPNSLMFNNATSPRAYIGSDVGLMWVDVTGANPTVGLVSNAEIPCNVSLCGKVLAISNDGKLVVISDRFNTPSQVYIYNGGATAAAAPVDLIIPGEIATAAAFSLDQSKVFILTDTGRMYVYSTVDALTSVSTTTPGTDVKFSADGSYAYVAGAPGATSISGFATCNAEQVAGPLTTPGAPVQLFPSPDAQHVLVLDPSNGGIDIFSSSDAQVALPDGKFTCNAPTVNFPTPVQSFDLGQGKNFVPLDAELVANGTQMVIVAKKIPAVLLFSVNNGTTTAVPLLNSADPLSASASPDGSQVDVAACDQYQQDGTTCAVGSIHIVSTTGQGDYQQVPYVNLGQNGNRNMCNNLGNPTTQCLPDLVAIRPQ